VFTGAPQLRRWPFDTSDGVRDVEVSGNLSASSAETLLQLALMGAGITRLADVIVGDPVAKGLLVSVLAEAHHVERCRCTRCSRPAATVRRAWRRR